MEDYTNPTTMKQADDHSDNGITVARRSLRPRRMTSRAIQSSYMKKLRDSLLQEFNSSDSEDEEIDLEPSDDIEKPTVINTVSKLDGDKLFSFQKRAARGSLTHKVLQVKEHMAQTPHHVRNKIKKKIVAEIHDSSSGHDFSDSGSEYMASENSTNTSSESDASESEHKEEDDTSSDESKTNQSSKKSKASGSHKLESSTRTSVHRKIPNKKYVIKTEDYFANHSSKKILTSNHTLDKLDTPRLPQHQLKLMLEKMKLTNEHQKSVKGLSAVSRGYFEKWLYYLQENFNILLYGLGCKRHIIDEFRIKYLTDCPVIVVNGFFPTITVKDILDSIIVDLLDLKENPANPYEACDVIEQQFNNNADVHLYLIVHNIEGEMLRGKKSQDVLAKLASTKNIHLIASIDHINAPLIWDHSKLSKFHYTWWDVTSFLPYIEETSFESSLLVQGAGTLALSSLRNVFLSLTTNSKGIYIIIVRHQLENAKNQYYQGLAFKDLYWSTREAFLVSSDLALRAQLNEFVDHKMVRYKRSIDGTEYLMIPIANALLKKFLDEQPK